MIQKIDHSKHEFALYLHQITDLASSSKAGDIVNISDPNLYHRITRVLRLSPGESCILFDQNNHMHCEFLAAENKNGIVIKFMSLTPNHVLKPSITFLLPLLKREAWHQAVYSLTELGATTIQPIITKKGHRSYTGNSEVNRIERIIHAAAEQSKNFSFPTLENPRSLEDSIKIVPSCPSIYFDPNGNSLIATIEKLKKTPPEHLVLMVGPEADLAVEEKEGLKRHSFMFCKLTPTILRAQQAAAISLGAFRSLFS